MKDKELRQILIEGKILERYGREVRGRFVTKTVVKDMVVKAVQEAFRPDDPLEYRVSLFGLDREPDIKGTLEDVVRGLVGKAIANGVQAEINRLINPEEFIDKVVKRIKVKQLSK